MGAGGSESLAGWLLLLARTCPLGQVGSRLRCAAVGLRGAEVVGRREVELRRLMAGEGRRGKRRAEGAGSARGCRAGLLEVGESARLRAVGGTVGLLVAAEAELVGPEIESHGDG